MTLATAVFLGFVQGVAEFLPISSSGHLAILQNFFGMKSMESDELLLFDVLLHFATLVAVIIAYRTEIAAMLFELFRGLSAVFSKQQRRAEADKPVPPARRLVLLIILATFPLLLALPFYHAISSLSSNSLFIGFALIVNGLILFFSDRITIGRKNTKNATVLDALVVGAVQAVAIIPGISRSGSTISAGMLRGFNRSFAVKFSFLLSLPAILGANILSFKNALETGIQSELIPVFLAGMLVAGVVGYFAIRLVNLLARKGKFGAFSYYCWAVGLITIIASLAATPAT